MRAPFPGSSRRKIVTRDEILDMANKWTQADLEEIEASIIALRAAEIDEDTIEIFTRRYAELAGEQAARDLDKKVAGGMAAWDEATGTGRPRS
jgi:hypothetical protein